MTRDIAHGEAVIGADTSALGAGLQKAEADFTRTMNKIGRMSAEAKAQLDIRPLEKKIVDAKRKLLELEKEKANASADMDTSKLTAKIAAAKLAIKELNQQKVEIGVDSTKLKDANKQLDVSARKQAQMSAESIRQLRVEEQKNRTLADAPAQIAKARMEYAKLSAQQKKLSGSLAQQLGFDPKGRLELEKVNGELSRLQFKIKSLGGDTNGLDGLFDEDSSDRIRKWATSLGSVRIQAGFFSATLRQASAGFAALGPVIFGVMGQIVSLVGVLGTGLAGAMSVGAASLSGFGLSALGVGLILKPLVGQITDATKASSAYDDAVRKYGKGSSEAQGKLEQLNTTLGNISPEAKKAFVSFGSLSDRWNKLTSAARTPFFDTVGKGIQGVNRLLPMFANESTRTFAVASKAANKWIDSLSSPSGAGGIQSIMSSFRAAIPGINSGLMGIGRAFGNISVSAGKLLPELTSGFAEWSGTLADGVGSGAELDSSIRRLVDHMQQIGHFAQAAGSMLATFFNAGANEGATLLGTLTNIANQWNAWMQSASGQTSLANFFTEANAIGSAFIGTLAQVGVALFELSSALAPLSQGFVAVISTASQLVSALMGLGAARAVVTMIGGALAGAFIGGKIMAAVTAVQALGAALRGLATASALSTLATSINPIMAMFTVIGAGIAAFALLKSGSESATTSLEDMAAAAQAVESAISAMNSNDVSTASAGLQLAAATKAKAAAQEKYNNVVKQYGKGSQQAKIAEQALTQATVSRQQAAQSMNTAVKTGQDNYTKAIDKTNKALDLSQTRYNAIRDKINKYTDDGQKGYNGLEDDTADLAKEEENLLRLKNKQVALNNAQSKSDLNTARAYNQLAPVLSKVGAAWHSLRTQMPQKGQAVIENIVNPQDAAKAIQLTNSLKNMGKLGAANKILVNTGDIDKAIAKLQNLQNKARQQSRGKVDVDTSAAEAKQQRLRTNFQKNFKSKVNVDADTKGADAKIKEVKSQKGDAKIRVTADGGPAQKTINQISHQNIPAKKLKITGDASSAASAINKIQGTKLNDKKFNIKVDDGEAKSAKSFVDSIPDSQSKALTMKAEYSALQNAKSYLDSIQSKTVTVTINTQKTGAGSAAGSVPGMASGGSQIGPARSRLLGKSADRAHERQNRSGLYKRPTLLVGEENQDEYVIATNPAYRTSNVNYLRQAAGDFGYQLVAAATGKKPKKKAPPKLSGSASKYGKTRTPYDDIRDHINRLTTKSSNMAEARNANLDAGRPEGYSLDAVINPLNEALDPWYVRLRNNITKRANKAAKKADQNKKNLTKKGGLADDLKSAKSQLNKAKGMPKKSDDQKKKRDKAIREAENAVEKAKTKKDNAKSQIQTRGDTAGQLARELAGLDNEKASITNTIQSLRDAEADRLEQAKDEGDTAASTTTPIGVQLAALDKERYDFFNQFSSNTIGASGSFGGPSTPSFYGGVGGGSVGAAAGLGGVPAAGAGNVPGAAGSGPRGGGVTQNITIAEAPPNAHIFSQEMAWEAGAVGY